MCLGHLTALIASAATSIDNVAHLGLELVAVAFRLGFACQMRSHHVDPSGTSWARIVFEADPETLRDCLDRLNEVNICSGMSMEDCRDAISLTYAYRASPCSLVRH